MRNILIDESRKKAALLESPEPDDKAPRRSLASRPDEDQARADDAIEHRQRHQAIQQQLAALSPEERCFLLTVLETDSVPAAQKRCGWPPKSPYYVLKKLLEKLRGELSEWAPT